MSFTTRALSPVRRIAAACVVLASTCSWTAHAAPPIREDRGVLRLPEKQSPDRTNAGDGNHPLELGDTTTSCQENPNNVAVENVICTFADLTAVSLGPTPDPLSLTIADNFNVQFNGQLTGITWWGFMIERAGQGMVNDCTLNIAPVSRDRWNIRYYVDNGLGFPDLDQIIAEFAIAGTTPGYTRIDTGEDPFGLVSKMEMHYDFPAPIPVTCGVQYHVEIYSDYFFNDCFFCWQPAPPGDARSLQTDFDPDIEELPDWGEDDINNYDMAQCQDVDSFGPEANRPRVTLTRVGPPDVQTGCCEFRYTVQNGNCIGVGPISTFFVAFAKGTAEHECEGLEHLSPPVGWNVEFCEPWSTDGRAIFKFTGGSLAELQSTYGTIRTRVNGQAPVVLDPDNIVPAFGIRAWASDDALAGAACGTGQFGPLEGETGGWGDGRNGECPFQPIPSLSSVGKGILASLLVAGGLLLVFRSRTALTA